MRDDGSAGAEIVRDRGAGCVIWCPRWCDVQSVGSGKGKAWEMLCGAADRGGARVEISKPLRESSSWLAL